MAIIQALWHAALHQREALADHVLGYGELAWQDARLAAQAPLRRVLWALAALALALMAVLLGSVATFLVATLPDVTWSSTPVLWLIPLAMAVLALFCAGAARHAPVVPPFQRLKAQWQADQAAINR